MVPDLVQRVRDGQVVLFVGAGVSATLGLPTWSQLIEQMAEHIDYDPEIFRSLADQYSLAEFYEHERNGLGELRQWMDQEFHKSSIDIGSSRAHTAIIALRCRRLYTTNWDNWLERAYDFHGIEYEKIVSVHDMANADDSKSHIVKHHGDFSEDGSLVFTERSYFDRMSFDAPLDLKFRADTVGRSILFVGYSVSDINHRLMLYRLHRLWKDSAYESERPPSYVFLVRPNAVQQRILTARGLTPIIGDHDDPTRSLTDFLVALVQEVDGSCI